MNYSEIISGILGNFGGIIVNHWGRIGESCGLWQLSFFGYSSRLLTILGPARSILQRVAFALVLPQVAEPLQRQPGRRLLRDVHSPVAHWPAGEDSARSNEWGSSVLRCRCGRG